MNLPIREFKEYHIVDLPSSLRDENAFDLRREFMQIALTGLKHVVLNLSQVQHLSSHPIGLLVTLWKEQVRSGGTLQIIAQSQDIRQILKAMRIHSIIKVFESEEMFTREVKNAGAGAIRYEVSDAGKYRMLTIQEPLNVIGGYQELNVLLGEMFAQRKTHLALNLVNTIHLYSDVIGVIVKWNEKLIKEGGEFALVGLNSDLRSRLEYLDLDRILKFYESEKNLPDE